MKIKIIILFTLLFPITLTSQNSNINIGEWYSFLPYKQGVSLDQSADNIIYATPFSIFTIDKKDFSFQSYDKTNGLSDVGIDVVRYDYENEQLFIVYTNNNIDVIKNGDTFNIPDIKINKTIIGSKEINELFFGSDSVLYFATSFGIVEFRTDKLEFGSTIFTSENVKSITQSGSHLIALLESEIYAIDLATGKNIADFSNWDKIDTNTNVYDLISIKAIGKSVFLISENDVKKGELNSNFNTLNNFLTSGEEISIVKKDKNQLLIGTKNDQGQGHFYAIDDNGVIKNGTTNCNNIITDVIQDEEDRYWFGDLYRGIRYTKGFGGECQIIDFPSFLTAEVSDIALRGEDVFVASGGVNDNYSLQFNRSGLFTLQSGKFINYNEFSFSPIKREDFLNVFQVEVNPQNGLVYMGAYSNGIIELNTETGDSQHFDTENSGLQHAKNESDGERISGLDFDAKGNLWINNIFAPKPIVVYTADGQWYNYASPTDGFLAKLKVDPDGLVWSILVGTNGGIHILDTNGTIEDTSDDKNLILNTGNSALTTANINCIEIDAEDQVWVGTDEGPVVFSSGSSVFQDDTPGNRLKVDIDGNVNFLLSDEDIRCIAFDGGDRKWFGTRNGIFVMSANGRKQIAHYTEANSPLFSNKIIELEFADNGTMYVGTDRGIQSIKTETTRGAQRHVKKDVFAFPNPVRPEYKGSIYIKGLAKNAEVKITDVNGYLVKEITALGGQAIWDGTNLKNKRVSSGVYLVFSTASVGLDKSDSYVTKIMVIQ